MTAIQKPKSPRQQQRDERLAAVKAAREALHAMLKTTTRRT